MITITRRSVLKWGGLSPLALPADGQQQPTPARPSLAAGEDASRGVDFLDIVYQPVAGANRHELRIRSAQDDRIVAATGQTRFFGLAPNTVYQITLRAIIGGNPTAWSDALSTITRPPAPTAPAFAPSGSSIGLAWDLTALTAGIANVAALRVMVGRKSAAGTLADSSGDLEVNSRFAVDSRAIADEFALALVFRTSLLASGVNRSLWSPTVRPLNGAGPVSLFTTPARFNLNLPILRRYHARRIS